MRRVTRWVAGLAGAVLILGACGGGGGSGDGSIEAATGAGAEKLIAASADKADAAGTARMRGGITVDGTGVPNTPRFEMDGLVDFETGALEFRLDMSGLGKGASGFEMRMRQVDGVSYMRFDAPEGRASRELDQLTGGKEWIKVDPAAMGVAPETGDANPGSTMDALRGISDVKVVGTEKLDGEDATHYRGTIDVSKAADRMPEDSRAKGMLRNMFSEPWDADVWVGADGMARKVRIEVDGRLHMVEEFEYFDFGVPVDLSAPPAGDVADFQDVFPSMVPGSTSASTPAA